MTDFTFQDYLEQIKNPEKKEWLPVAGFWNYGHESHLMIFSALFENNQKNRKKILSNYQRDLHFDTSFHPNFVTYFDRGKQEASKRLLLNQESSKKKVELGFIHL